jgi:hypothetical protein
MATPTICEAQTIKQVLTNFMEPSRMSINQGKSHIFFFNTPLVIQAHLIGIISYQRSSLLGRTPYLEWLRSWIVGHFYSLNLVGKLVLIKSVLQAMPMYLFYVLAAPKYILKIIRNMHQTLLSGGTKERRKWALVSWVTVCFPKLARRLGLRDP